MTEPTNTVCIETHVLEAMMRRAAEEGAKRVLSDIGLGDEGAGNDVKALRSLLDAWRDAKTTAWRALVQAVTRAVLAVMVAGIAWHWWGPK